MKNRKEEVIGLINNVHDILNKVLDCKNMEQALRKFHLWNSSSFVAWYQFSTRC